MSHFIDNSVFDAALNDIKSNCNSIVLYSGGATDYATITGAAAVLTVSAAATDFTIAAGSPSGRKVRYGGKTGASVSGAGGAVDSIAFLDTVNSVVKAVSDYTSKTLNTGDTEDISAFDLFTINNPA